MLCITLAWFGPVLFGGKVFITDNYLGAFYIPLRWWSDLLFSGFPLYADLNFGNAYPIRMAFSGFADMVGRANAYNFFVWSAFAIGAVGTYLYVFELTREAAAAAIAGCGFAFSGFMQAHVGHETITHTATWLPFVIWTTHRIVSYQRWRDVATLSLVAAAMYLANHPEIYLQVALVSALYAVWMGIRVAARARAAMMLISGWAISVALVAWQLIGAIEYAALSQRVATARILTLHGALPFDQIAQVVLPWVFGMSIPTAAAPLQLFGYEMAMEVAAYVAPAVFILAAFGAANYRSSRASGFWLLVAVLFFLLALGPQTLLGKALFFAPGFRLFNIPGRNLLSMHFALSVLCGLGAASILGLQSIDIRKPFNWVLGLLPTVAAVLSYPLIERKANLAGVVLPPVWQNIAVVLPVGIALVSVIAIVLSWRVRGPVAAFLLMSTVVGGSAYFGWNAPWKTASGPAMAMLDEPRVVKELKRQSASDGRRVLAADGWVGPLGVNPNQSMLFGLLNVAGYGPLLSRDYAAFAGLTNSGWTNPAAFTSSNTALDLLATRWIFPYAQTGAATETVEKLGIKWNPTPFPYAIGGGCAGVPLDRSVSFRLPKPGRVRGIAMVSSLGCGLDIPQGTVVAHAVLEGRDARGALRIPIAAGKETAEWTAACRAPGSNPLHQPARAFDTTALPAVGPGCEGHQFVAELPAEDWDTETIRIEWSIPAGSYAMTMMKISQMTVLGAEAADMQALDPGDETFADKRRWRHQKLASGHDVYENVTARPLAWVVDAVHHVLNHDQAIEIARSGRLPDGRRFEPATTAIMTDTVSLPAVPMGASSPVTSESARVQQWRDGKVSIDVRAGSSALLVVSQRFYPGWVARLDGNDARILRVDGVLQGVEVPPGRHTVVMEFAPPRLPWLLALAALGLIVAAALMLRGGGVGKPATAAHGY